MGDEQGVDNEEYFIFSKKELEMSVRDVYFCTYLLGLLVTKFYNWMARISKI